MGNNFWVGAAVSLESAQHDQGQKNDEYDEYQKYEKYEKYEKYDRSAFSSPPSEVTCSQ